MKHLRESTVANIERITLSDRHHVPAVGLSGRGDCFRTNRGVVWLIDAQVCG